jgi:hypothetical protein
LTSGRPKDDYLPRIISWRGRLELLLAGGAWIGLCHFVFGHFGIDGNWLTAARIPGSIALLLALVPENRTRVSEPRLEADTERVAYSRLRMTLRNGLSLAGFGLFIGSLVVAIRWEGHWLFWAMFGTMFVCAVVLHCITDRKDWVDW